jgi:hypothetical protein
MYLQLIFLLCCAGAAVFAAQRLFRRLDGSDAPAMLPHEPLSPEMMEKQVLRLAMKAGGKITLPEICLQSPLSVDEARETLQALCEKDVMRLQLADNGTKVYALVDWASDDEKQRAIDLL